MKKEKNNNIGMKVLSVIIAILIWLLVANTNDPVMTKRFSNVSVTVVNEEELTEKGYAYEIIEGSEVSFSVKGKKSIVGNMTVSDFTATADFSKLSLMDAVPIDIEPKKYADQLEVTVGSTNTMKIKKDEMISISVPVNITTKGEPTSGYVVGRTTGKPNLIKVTGPAKMLSKAKEIRAEVEVSGIENNITTTVKPKLYSNDGDVIHSPQIEYDTNVIEVSVELWKTRNTQIELSYEGEPEPGYALVSFDYEPKSIQVAMPDDVQHKKELLDLGSISIEGQSADYEQDIPLKNEMLPENVVLADPSESIKVRAKIEKKITRKIVFSKNELTEKNNQGYSITFAKDNDYSLDIEGADSVVREVKISDFKPWINLQGLSEGEHELPIHVRDVDGVAVNAISKIKVSITKN